MLLSVEAATLIRESRRRQGLTQAQLGSRLGTTQAAVASLERRGANPTVATLERVLRAAGRRLVLETQAHRSSVDETLVASLLRRTPAQRLANFESWYRDTKAMTDAVRSARGGSA